MPIIPQKCPMKGHIKNQWLRSDLGWSGHAAGVIIPEPKAQGMK